MDIFDSHCHIIDPEYPVIENQGYSPNPFTCEDYLNAAEKYNMKGGVVVSGSFQGYDYSYLKSALEKLGNDYVGVANISPDWTDEELSHLDSIGVRGIRFNFKRGGGTPTDVLEQLGRRVFNLFGWHSELYIDTKDLKDIKREILNLPKVSIDHLGFSTDGQNTLLELVEKGIQVKATGFGRIDLDPISTMQKIHKINPKALMFGSDLPSTRAVRPFSSSDINLIKDNFSKEDLDLILKTNARQFYRIN